MKRYGPSFSRFDRLRGRGKPDGESYGYDGQNDLTGDEEKQLKGLFNVIEAQGEDVPQE